MKRPQSAIESQLRAKECITTCNTQETYPHECPTLKTLTHCFTFPIGVNSFTVKSAQKAILEGIISKVNIAWVAVTYNGSTVNIGDEIPFGGTIEITITREFTGQSASLCLVLQYENLLRAGDDLTCPPSEHTVSNSDDSFLVVISTDYELEDYEIKTYVDGILTDTQQVPAMEDITITIS